MKTKTKRQTEDGAASILIELEDGNITVKHGTDGSVLLIVENALVGSWDKLWDALYAIEKSAK